jgi:hypothetical protein
MMSYTIWSHDRLLGETDLAWVRCMENLRSGFFHPSELGTRFMPTVCGVSPAMRELSEARQELKDAHDDQADGVSERALTQTTQYADMLAAIEHERGLSLELRGPDGRVIPTEDIFIQDNEYLLSLAEKADEAELYKNTWDETTDLELDEELQAAVEHDLELLFPGGVEDWESGDWVPDDEEPVDFPRYQIHVRLINDADVP